MDQAMSANWKRTFGVLWICVFLVCASYTMVVPFLPLFLVQELHLPAANAKMWSGVIIAVTFVLAGVMAPYWGARGDVSGQKINAIRAGVGLTFCYAATALVTDPWQLLGVRVLMGIISGFVPACMAMASYILPESRMGWGMGLMQTANSSGSIMGPLLGGFLSSLFGMRMSFMVAAGSLGLAALALVFLVPRDHPKGPSAAEAKQGMFQQLGGMLTQKTLFGILLLFALVKACIMVVQPLLTIYVNDLLQGAPDVVTISGVILSLAGIAGIVAAPFWGTQGAYLWLQPGPVPGAFQRRRYGRGPVFRPQYLDFCHSVLCLRPVPGRSSSQSVHQHDPGNSGFPAWQGLWPGHGSGPAGRRHRPLGRGFSGSLYDHWPDSGPDRAGADGGRNLRVSVKSTETACGILTACRL